MAKGGKDMELIENLFVAGNVTDLETAVYRLRRGIPVLHLYCVVWFADRNRLEILSSRELFHQRNQNRFPRATLTCVHSGLLCACDDALPGACCE